MNIQLRQQIHLILQVITEFIASGQHCNDTQPNNNYSHNGDLNATTY